MNVSCGTNLIDTTTQLDESTIYSFKNFSLKQACNQGPDYSWADEIIRETSWNTSENDSSDLDSDVDVDIYPNVADSSPSNSRKLTSTNKDENDESGGCTSNKTPLPLIPWANNQEVWNIMNKKEEPRSGSINVGFFEFSESLGYLRTVLIDWTRELSYVNHLSRVTCQLAIDYINRYLTVKPTVEKPDLILIGITSLFLAAKLEETYSPRLETYSEGSMYYYTTEEIKYMEKDLLMTLKWDIHPITPTAWLGLFIQIYSCNEKVLDPAEVNYEFIFPQYSSKHFIQASNLIDLFSLDPDYLRFTYKIIAASAIYYLYGKVAATRVSGMKWDDISECIDAMEIYQETLLAAKNPKLESLEVCTNFRCCTESLTTFEYLQATIPDITMQPEHLLQTHVINLEYLEKVTALRLKKLGFTVRHKPPKKNKAPDDGLPLPSHNENLREDIPMYHVNVSPHHIDFSDFSCDGQIAKSIRKMFNTKRKLTFEEVLKRTNHLTIKRRDGIDT